MTQRTLERSRRKRAEELDDEVPDAQTADDGDDEDNSSAISAKKGRATPGRRNQEVEEKRGNFFVRAWRGIREYFSEVRDELTKVTWPTREDVVKLTRIVLSALVVSSLVMGLISLGMGETIRIGLANPIILVAILAAAIGVAVWSQRRSAGVK
ncbi:MAG: preprotein translocase subunit SecE [Anaerolineae bacterium]|nr:preprotein translocase subunit SecE [Anaerolineae bacterium]MDW8174001.1 preprotein translocase subunit SecE [Anaerolineae bacterium]